MNIKSDLAIMPASSGTCKTMVDNTLRITFDFEPRHAASAFKLFGERGTLAAIALIKQQPEGNDEPQETAQTEDLPQAVSEKTKAALASDRPYGQHAATLYKSGFFLVPPVWRALGSDKEYRQWIQKQPSAYSKNYSEWIDGEGRCIAAHVRRSGEAGTGYKPVYACIPLTNAEHQLQHQKGESALKGLDFDKARVKYLQAWCVSRLYSLFGVDSLTKMRPNDFTKWATRHDLTVFIPRLYKDAVA